MRNLIIAAAVALTSATAFAQGPRECKAIANEFTKIAEEKSYLIEMPIQDQYSSGAVFLDPERQVRIVVGIGLAPYLASVAQQAKAGGATVVAFEPCVAEGVEVPLAFLHIEAALETEEAQVR